MNRIPVSDYNNSKSNQFVENPRCFKLFESACKTEATRKTYTKLLDYFYKF